MLHLKTLMYIISVATIHVYVLLAPNPVKYLFFRWSPCIEIYLSSDNAEHFNSLNVNSSGTVFQKYLQNTDATLYRGVKSVGKNLIVWFNGGAFLRTDRRSSFGVINDLSKLLSTFDIVTFDYPVRFIHTVADALKRVYLVLGALGIGVGDKPTYTNIHAVGTSAGVLLAGAFQQNETYNIANKKIGIPRLGVRFSSITSLCGLLTQSFDIYYLDKLFEFFVMRGTAGKEYYTCVNLSKTPKFVASTIKDYLFSSAIRFLDTEVSTSHIYNSRKLMHSFPLTPHLPETQDLLKRITIFIIQNSQSS